MNTKLMHPAEQIVMMINRVYKRGLTTTSGGNLSIKDCEGNIWITPSGIDKGSLTPADICKVLPDGTVIGKYKPSVELPFHKSVYEARPEVKAVLHAHPPALVSYSLTRKVPATNVIPVVADICKKVGIACYEVPGSDVLADRIVTEIKKGYDAVVMENHGIVCYSSTIFEAYKQFETINYCAQLAITSSVLGKTKKLSVADIKKYVNAKKDIKLKEFNNDEITSEESSLRKEICYLVKRSYEQNIFTSTLGLFSAKLADGSILVSPDNVDRYYIEPEDVVKIKDDKKEKGKEVSRYYPLLKAIYDKHPDVKAIAIGSPVNLMAFASTNSELDSRTIPESYIEMRDVKRIPFGSEIFDVKGVANIINSKTPVVLSENGVVITTAPRLIKAFDKIEVAEFTANTIIRAKMVGKIVMISDEEVDVINKAFNL